jgi:hypothetical protein
MRRLIARENFHGWTIKHYFSETPKGTRSARKAEGQSSETRRA